jgi:hypothetical protein
MGDFRGEIGGGETNEQPGRRNHARGDARTPCNGRPKTCRMALHPQYPRARHKQYNLRERSPTASSMLGKSIEAIL